MSVVGVRALKQNASAVVAAAAKGEIVTVTDRGRPVAQLGPLPASRLESLLLAGLARPAKLALADLEPPPPKRRGRRPLSGVLAEMRDEERP